MIVLKRARTHLAETGAYHRHTAPKIQAQGQEAGCDHRNGPRAVTSGMCRQKHCSPVSASMSAATVKEQ